MMKVTQMSKNSHNFQTKLLDFLMQIQICVQDFSNLEI